MPRRIKRANVKFVSLCKRGKNRLPVLYKSEDGSIEFQTLSKASETFDEKGELLCVVYPANLPDADKDFAGPDGIKSMAYSFMRNGANIDVQHDGKALTKEQAYPAESFIIQKGDPRFVGWKDDAGKEVNTEGSWGAVFKIEDPTLRKLYREGGWDGVSLFGTAEEIEHVEKAQSGSLLDELRRLVDETRRVSTHEEIDMKPEDIGSAVESALEKGFTKFGETLSGILQKAINPPAPTSEEVTAAEAVLRRAGKTVTVSKAADAPATPAEFDPTNLNHVKLKLAELRKAQLAEEVDFDDPDSVEEYLSVLEKGASKGSRVPRRLQKSSDADEWEFGDLIAKEWNEDPRNHSTDHLRRLVSQDGKRN